MCKKRISPLIYLMLTLTSSTKVLALKSAPLTEVKPQSVSREDVRTIWLTVNTSIAAGPDNISDCMFNTHCNQSVDVIT